MIHIVTHANRARYAVQIEQMHKIRYEFYVRERGWTDLERGDGLEIDEYDDEDAVYLMHLDHEGNVDGSYRVYPTEKRSLLADKFPHLVIDRDVPAGGRIYEITRFFLSQSARRAVGTARSSVSAELSAGLIEFAVRRNLTHYTLVCDTFFLPRLQAIGWPFEHLGLPCDYREGTAMAVLIGAGAESLAISRRQTGLRRPITFEAAPMLAEDEVVSSPRIEGEILDLISQKGDQRAVPLLDDVKIRNVVNNPKIIIDLMAPDPTSVSAK